MASCSGRVGFQYQLQTWILKHWCWHLTRLHKRSTDISVSAHIQNIVVDRDVVWINYVDVTYLTNLGRVNIMTTSTQWLEFQLKDESLNHIRESYSKFLVVWNLKIFLLTAGTMLDGLEYNLVVLPRSKMSYLSHSGYHIGYYINRYCKHYIV